MINCLPAKSFLPGTAVLEMTYSCNHNCLFCSCPWDSPHPEISKIQEMNIEEWKSCVKKLVEMGITDIAFTGGEPLLKENLLDLIDFTSNLQATHIDTVDGELVTTFSSPRLYLLSNGKNMSEEVLNWCKKYSMRLSMSLPGLKTFAYHTGNCGTPENVLSWFEKASQQGISTTVNVTVTKKNLFELYETISHGLIAGAETLLMNRFLPGGRGLEHEKELVLNSDEVLQMALIAEEVLSKANRYGSIGTELPKCILQGKEFHHLEIGTRCSAAIGFFVIGPSGNIRVCNHSQVELMKWTDIEQLKNHPYWKTFVFKNYLPEACNHCSEMISCDGGCREAAHILGGKVDSPDPLLV